MLTTKTARWSALTALLCVMLMAAAYLLLISPRRAEAADVRQRAEQNRARNDALELKVAQLRAQFVDLPKNEAELNQIYAQMPAKAAMPELVRALDNAATSSGVTLQSLTPSVAGVRAATQSAEAAPAAGTGTSGASGTSGTAGSGTTGGAATATPAPAAASGLRIVEIPITLVVNGDYFQTVVFLKKIQTEVTRAFLISSLQLSSLENTASGSKVALTINGKVFALPDTVETTSGTTSGSAGAGSTGTTSGTTTSGNAGTSTTPSSTSTSSAGQAAALGSVSRMGASAIRMGENS